MRLLPLLALLVLAGCATPQASILSQTETFAPTTEVELLLDPPKRPYKSFALLEDWAGGTPQEINERLRQRGRELGADAVLIESVNNRVIQDWILTDPCWGRYRCGPRYRPVHHTYHSVKARALKYVDPR